MARSSVGRMAPAARGRACRAPSSTRGGGTGSRRPCVSCGAPAGSAGIQAHATPFPAAAAAAAPPCSRRSCRLSCADPRRQRLRGPAAGRPPEAPAARSASQSHALRYVLPQQAGATERGGTERAGIRNLRQLRIPALLVRPPPAIGFSRDGGAKRSTQPFRRSSGTRCFMDGAVAATPAQQDSQGTPSASGPRSRAGQNYSASRCRIGAGSAGEDV